MKAGFIKFIHSILFTLFLLSYQNVIAFELLGDRQYEILLFPSLHVEIFPDAEHSDREPIEVEYGSGAVFSLNYNRFHAITEAFISNHEIELERLQIGWQFPYQTRLWLGRYHSPIGYWNSEYHHGLHLQTSVHRPGITEYEDAGGVIPNHIVGILAQKEQSIGTGLISLSVSAGIGSEIKNRKLHAFHFDYSGKVQDALQLTARAYFQPDELDQSRYGVFYTQARIKSSDQLVSVKQKVLGVYTFRDWNIFNVIASVYFARHTVLDAGEIKNMDFKSGYIHGEYEFTNNWLVYSRVELSNASPDDPYLALLDHELSEKALVGIRYDFTRRQAISSEVSRRVSEHDSHTHVSLQWSAVFP